jgi:hypothetical protein
VKESVARSTTSALTIAVPIGAASLSGQRYANDPGEVPYGVYLNAVPMLES